MAESSGRDVRVVTASRALYYSMGGRRVAWEALEPNLRRQYEREGEIVVDALARLEGGANA